MRDEGENQREKGHRRRRGEGATGNRDGLAGEVGDATEKGSTAAAGVGDEREEGLGPAATGGWRGRHDVGGGRELLSLARDEGNGEVCVGCGGWMDREGGGW